MNTPSLAPTRYAGGMMMLAASATMLLAMGTGPRPPKPLPSTVRIVARDYGYTMPGTIAPGTVRIELINEGHELHHAQLMRLEQGRSFRDLAALPPDAPSPSWLVPVGGPNAAEPGDTSRAIVTLAPGNYAVVCVIPAADHQPHLMKGMATGFTVSRGPAVQVRTPTPDATVRLSDYAFAVSAPLAAGDRVLSVVNDASQPHELVLLKLDAGKTAADMVSWEPGTPPPGRFVGGIVAIGPGDSNLIELKLELGRYVMICYVPDAKDGMPHFMHGMVAPLTVVSQEAWLAR